MCLCSQSNVIQCVNPSFVSLWFIQFRFHQREASTQFVIIFVFKIMSLITHQYYQENEQTRLEYIPISDNDIARQKYNSTYDLLRCFQII